MSFSKQAATLTKQWLMGVRRGFLSVIPATVPDFDAALKTFVRLSNFVHRLELQVTRIRRGPNTDVWKEDLFKAFSRDLARLYEAIDHAEDSCRHWKSIHEGKNHLAVGPYYLEGAARQLNLYQTNFPEALSNHVPTRGRGPGGTRSASIIEIFDKMMKHLFEAAKAIDKGDYTETAKQYWADEIPIEFKIGSMTFVLVYNFKSGRLFNEYVREARTAYGKLRRWGLDKQTWYGVTFVMDVSAKKLTDDEKERYRHAGYDISAVGGDYSIGSNDVRMWTDVDRFQHTLIHELGHRYWFKHMSQSQRMKFIRSVWTKTHEKAVHPEADWVPRKEMEDQLKQKWQALVAKYTRDFHATAVKSSAGTVSKDWFRFRFNTEQETNGQVFHYLMGARRYLHEDVARFGKISSLPEYRAFDSLKQESDNLEQSFRDTLEALRVKLHPDADGTKAVDTPIEEADQAELDAVVQENYRQCLNLMERIPGVVEALVAAYLDVTYKDDEPFEKIRSTKMVEPVSDYGRTNPDEAWAEAFMHLVAGRPMSVAQIRGMLDIIKGARTAAQRVLNRFLAFAVRPPQRYFTRSQLLL